MKRHAFYPILILLLLATLLAGCDRSRREPTPAPAPTNQAIGKPAPDFVLKDTKGKSWRLSELKGKVVFVNFWATWCPPCRSEMPSMQELVQTLPAKDFQMLAILSNDQAEVAERFAAGIGFSAPILLDPENLAARAYGITGVPETYIVDRQGILREAVIGPLHWNSPEARRMLAGYL